MSDPAAPMAILRPYSTSALRTGAQMVLALVVAACATWQVVWALSDLSDFALAVMLALPALLLLVGTLVAFAVDYGTVFLLDQERFEVRAPIFGFAVEWTDVRRLSLHSDRTFRGEYQAQITLEKAGGDILLGRRAFYLNRLRPAAIMSVVEALLAHMPAEAVDLDMVVVDRLLHGALAARQADAAGGSRLVEAVGQLRLVRAARIISTMRHPSETRVLNLSGGVLYLLHRVDAAQSAADEILALRPDDFEALLIRGLCLRTVGSVAAIAVLHRAAEVSPLPYSAIVTAEADRLDAAQ